MKITTLRMFKSFIVFSILLLSSNQMFGQLDAQLSLDDAFARGNFLEIGINQSGTFGVPNAQFPGAPYHPSRETGNDLFGFIANPIMDGWIDYDGDFFTPGSPEEGWGIEFNGGTVYNNNLAGPNLIPGAVSGANILSDPCFGDFAQINWNGFVDGIEIIRDISISRDGLFIRMEQRMTNLSADVITDLYWMNNVDPDNNQTINGSFTTDQELLEQPSGGLDILGFVCASQGPLGGTDANGSSVCYYVQDVRSRVTFGGFTNRDPSDIWNGVGFEQTEGATNTADEAISVAFFFGDLAPGESVNFTYFYVFRDFTGGGVDPTFISLTPVSPSTCGGTDGSIVISGLLPSTDYTISYEDDGVPVGPIILPADASGVIILSGLDAGVYTDFTLTNDSGCFFTNDGPIIVEDPGAPAFGVSIVDSLVCDNDGSLILTGLDPSTGFNLTYTQDGVVIGPTAVLSDAAGEIFITGLGEVTITDITLEIGTCTFTDPGPYTLTYPNPTLTVTTADPVMCDSDGSLTIEILNPSTDYEVTYTVDGVVVGPVTITTDAAGILIIPGLDEGTYTDITLVLNECTYIIPGPFELNRPSFDGVEIIGTDPSTCGPTGSVIITGVLPDTTYTLSYTVDGVPVGPIVVTSDSSGNIIISGLVAGVYDNGVLTFNDCVWNQPEPLTLTNPPNPTFTVVAVDSDICGPNGSLILSGLDPDTTYEVTYTVDGVVVGPITVTSDAAGVITFSSLNGGTYTDITVDLGECVTVDPGPYVIDFPADPTFTVTTIDPTTCSADGTIILGGLVPDTEYQITYTYNGTVVGPLTLTTDSAGNITITGLDQGTYTDFIADLGDCAGTVDGPFTINYPADPSFTVTPVDSATCTADGSLQISGLDPSTTYNVTYTYNGTVVGPVSVTTDASGNIIFTGLDQGEYTDVTIEVGGCVGVDPGPYTISYPALPAINDPAPYEVCAEEDGSGIYDLMTRDSEITGADATLVVSYHETAADAESGDNPLTSPYTSTSNPQTIYVRVVDPATGCYSATTLELIAQSIPALTAPTAVESCPGSGSVGLTNQFDLTLFESELGIDLAGLTVSYHTSSDDADDGTNAIASPSSYTNTESPQTIYIRVASSEGCFETTSTEISVIQCEIIIPQGISPNGDGMNDAFSINGLELHPNYVLNIFDRRGLLVYSGNASSQDWDGKATEQSGNLLPVGTYFYTLQLNDGPNDPFANVDQLYSGYVYLNY
ncbi:MAG: gliding motility-associated C-terminal domain-containing protein [Gilvibacter sp.]